MHRIEGRLGGVSRGAAVGRASLKRAAPLLDAACFVIFVLVGEHTHGESGGGWTFLAILWPLLVGWAVLALATGLYTRGKGRVWMRLGVTWIAGLALGLLMRGALTGRPVTPGFVAVTFAFIGATTIGWRIVALLVLRVSGRWRVGERSPIG